MPGHIHKRTHRKKNGEISVLYYAVIELPPSLDGKRRAEWGSGHRRKKEADADLVQRLNRLHTGAHVERHSMTIAHLLPLWLGAVRDSVKASTFDSYQRSIDDYLLPHVGHSRLCDLDSAQLQSLMALLRERGGIRRGRSLPLGEPLAPKTVRNHVNVLGSALNYAVSMRWLASNPMTGVRKPSARRTKEITSWSAADVAAFLDATADHPLQTLFRVAFFTGARRGELLGLRWGDVDFPSRRVSIRQTLILVKGRVHFDTPKSHEARTVDLDAETVVILEDRRRAVAGGPEDLVFADEAGAPLRPDTVSVWFRLAVERSGVMPRISLQNARHTHATLLLKAGVPVQVVSQRLGHADVGFTLRVYSHVLPGMQAEAASAFAGLIESQHSGSTTLRLAT